MARKPNYDFERKERERVKAEKKAMRAAEKKKAREMNSEPSVQNDAEIAPPSSTDS
jgi:hypothetical protein